LGMNRLANRTRRIIRHTGGCEKILPSRVISNLQKAFERLVADAPPAE